MRYTQDPGRLLLGHALEKAQKYGFLFPLRKCPNCLPERNFFHQGLLGRLCAQGGFKCQPLRRFLLQRVRRRGSQFRRCDLLCAPSRFGSKLRQSWLTTEGCTQPLAS